MAASKVTLQSAATLWVRTTASEVHSQQSLVRAARHDPRTERTRFGHTHVTRAALRGVVVVGAAQVLKLAAPRQPRALTHARRE